MYDYEKKETLLKIDNVTQVLGGNIIIRELSGEIKNIVRPGMSQGQVVALLGPSGIGKTQLFRISAGLQSPTGGSVLLGADSVSVKRGQVGVVAQHYPLFKHRTVLDNVVVAGRQAKMTAADAKKKAIELLNRFGLQNHLNRFPSELSGGQRQRVAIVQQIICSDKFLLMDEPYSGLDPLMKDEVIRLTLQVSSMDEHMTIIVTTHDIPSAVQVADMIWVLGYDRDPTGKFLPGARVQKVYDLADPAVGLAWRPDMKNLPQFHAMINEIEELFKTLK